MLSFHRRFNKIYIMKNDKGDREIRSVRSSKIEMLNSKDRGKYSNRKILGSGKTK